jgi:hypothetical protein
VAVVAVEPGRVSGEIGHPFGALGSKPAGELVVAFLEGDVERGEVAPADPVEVGAAGEEVLGDRLLVAMARGPEGTGDAVRGRWVLLAGEVDLDSTLKAQGGGILEPGGRPVGHQASRRRPLTEPDGVGERRAPTEHGAGGLDVGAGLEQGVDGGDVVAARRPVQRCLACDPTKRASGSAPAAAREAMVAATLGK